MKNKKGFTLIEIIISISLIAVISTITIIGINNNKNKNSEHLKSLHNKILEAATVFMSIEKDENGNSYDAALNMGAKGVKIPVNFLVENGYVDKNTIKEVYKLDKLDDTKNYFVLAVNGGSENNQDYCDVGEITLSLSWMDENKSVYLCKNYKKYISNIETIKNIQDVQNSVRLKVNIDKNAVSEEFYKKLSDEEKVDFVKDENGIFTLNDENVDKTYSYYRGSVDNNYLKLGKDSSNNDLIWRILWLNDDNKAKLILDKEIELNITKKNGETYTVKKNDTIINFDGKSSAYIMLNPQLINNYTYVNKYTDREYIYKFNNNDLLNDMIEWYDLDESGNIYYKKLQEWYQSTTLNEYAIVTNNKNFCKNDYYDSNNNNGKKYYSPSNTFACIYGTSSKNQNYNDSSLFYSSPVGFLTYGDVLRAGVKNNKGNIIEAGNYLLNNSNNSYPLVDYNTYRSDGDRSSGYDIESRDIYYVNNNGLNTGEIYLRNRDSNDNHDVIYSLKDENNNTIIDNIYNCHKHGNIMHKLTFYANSVKPAIIIDLTNKKLDGDGTSSNPFLVVDKD